MFGGDVTTARLRAERAVSGLAPFYPMSPRWTAKTPLPGGDFAWDRFEEQVDGARERWGFLGERDALRLVGAYKLPNALRMSVGTEEANRLVVQALKEFLGKAA